MQTKKTERGTEAADIRDAKSEYYSIIIHTGLQIYLLRKTSVFVSYHYTC